MNVNLANLIAIVDILKGGPARLSANVASTLRNTRIDLVAEAINGMRTALQLSVPAGGKLDYLMDMTTSIGESATEKIEDEYKDQMIMEKNPPRPWDENNS